jgi:hypothetical protein
MSDIVQGILFAPLALLFYGSGLTLWPIRRWLHRGKPIRGRFVAYTFFAQIAAYGAMGCASTMIRLEHGYDWFIIAIWLNLVFTVAGAIAWNFDARRKAGSGTGSADY